MDYYNALPDEQRMQMELHAIDLVSNVLGGDQERVRKLIGTLQGMGLDTAPLGAAALWLLEDKITDDGWEPEITEHDVNALNALEARIQADWNMTRSAATFAQEHHHMILAHAADGSPFFQTGNEVLVVALTDANQVLLDVEPSTALGKRVLVVPGGSVELHEEYSTTANRELQEEVGFAAQQLDYLGELHPWPKYLSVRSFVYLARNLREQHLDGDEGYQITVERVPLANFESLIEQGKLHDARAIAALHMARAFLSSR